jgi:hypothetical protein
MSLEAFKKMNDEKEELEILKRKAEERKLRKD